MRPSALAGLYSIFFYLMYTVRGENNEISQSVIRFIISRKLHPCEEKPVTAAPPLNNDAIASAAAENAAIIFPITPEINPQPLT